jgi:peptide/nickel transport system permease protein
MLRFIATRIVFTLVVLWGAATVIFLLSYGIPRDPARALLGENASPAQLAAYRVELGLDQPLYIQYARYMGRLVQGDLGTSHVSHLPVAGELMRQLPATLEIVIPSLVISGILGVILGVISAVRAGRWPDRVSQVGSLFGMSMPVFWMGLLLQLVFYRWLDVLPLGMRLPAVMAPPPRITGSYVVDGLLAGNFDLAATALKHLALPVLVLTVGGLPLMARLTRAVMLDILRLDFMRTARSKGLSERTVTYRHALRNALIPVTTVFGLRIAAALGGTVIVETIFSWPGVGRYVVQGINVLDYPVVTGVTLLLCAAYAVANLVVDLTYMFLDPRIRLR